MSLSIICLNECVNYFSGVGGDKIIWGWSEDGETYARTNTYTIFSLRMFGDLNFDDIINSSDYAAASSLTEHGWVMPVSSNSFRKVLLKNDVNFTGDFILSLTGDAGVRVWATATPTTNDTPLLITGQTVTNGVDGASFVSYPEDMIYVEAINSGTATLSDNYVGAGEHATGLKCKAALMISALQVNFPTNKHYSCLSCPKVHTLSLSSSSYTPNGATWSILPDLSGGASITSVASDYLSAVIDPGGIRTNYMIVVENSTVSECQDCIELIVGAYEWKDVGLLYDNPDFGVINYNTHLSPQYPAPHVYKVEPGQNMTFRVTIDDKDIRRQLCDTCNHSWKGTVEKCDDYRIVFTCSDFVNFDSPNSQIKSKTIFSKDSADIYAYCLSNFVWTAGSTQVVSAVLYDCNTNSLTHPDIGSNVDDPVTVTWLFTKPDYAPHHLGLNNGTTSWSYTGWYFYNVHPDPNNMPQGSQPYFDSYIIGESFTHVDPEFTMSDVDSVWLYDPNYPVRSSFYTANDVARHLWPGPGGSNNDGNGTFTITDDQIADYNSAHVYTEPFTAVALTNGVGFSCEQSFTFGVNVIGTCDLMFKRFATNNTTTVKKSIPY